jgi:F-type H+-transporting ATPase subunit epsilon
MTFRVTLATPDKVFFDGPATEAVCPGIKGLFGVLARHTRLMTALTTGILKVRGEGQDHFFVVDGGMVEAGNDRLDLLADAVIPAAGAADAEQKLEELKASRPAPVRRLS